MEKLDAQKHREMMPIHVRMLKEGKEQGAELKPLLDAKVEDFMCRDCDSVDGSDSLAVTQAGRVVGLLTLEQFSEMIPINAAISHADTARA